jgi:hypothetical protein
MKRVAAGLLLFAGCLKLDLADGVLLCNHRGKACPDGYACVASVDRCYRSGHAPDLAGLDGDLSGPTVDAACDGACDAQAPACSASGPPCPNGFACAAGACLTSCTTDADCQQPDFQCAEAGCVRVPESDCLDGIDNNGDGLSDCADPTCTDVECVPALPVGADFGILQTGACASASYATTTVVHQNLNLSNCGGCLCTTSTLCQANFDFIPGGTSCPRTPSESTVALTTGCLGVSGGDPANIYAYMSPVSTTCNVSGSSNPSPPSPMWMSTQTFCSVSRSSSTCTSASQVCIAKPPAATPLCVRSLGTGDACLAGFTTTGDWFGNQMDPRTCGPCACTKMYDGTCQREVFTFYTDQPAICGGTGSPFQTGQVCVVSDQPTCYAKGTTSPGCVLSNTWGGSGSIAWVTGYLDGVGGTCNPPTSAVLGSPTGGATICCRN